MFKPKPSMKRLLPILTICFMILSSTVYAQQEEKPSTEKNEDSKAPETNNSHDFGKNELKLNLFSAVLSTLDISYERLLKDNTSIGLSGSYCFFSEPYEGFSSDYLWSFIPYYRLYFSKKPSSGFFIEANAVAAQTREITGLSYYDSANNYIEQTTYHDNLGYGIGFSLGAKFLTAKGLIGEAHVGLGRYLNAKGDYMPKTYPRFGVLIGKRF